MNNLKRLTLGAVFAVVAMMLVMLAVTLTTSESTAAINRLSPVPQSWGASDGSAFSLSYQAVPVYTVNGTNYTGINATINNGTNTYHFVRGSLFQVTTN